MTSPLSSPMTPISYLEGTFEEVQYKIRVVFPNIHDTKAQLKFEGKKIVCAVKWQFEILSQDFLRRNLDSAAPPFEIEVKFNNRKPHHIEISSPLFSKLVEETREALNHHYFGDNNDRLEKQKDLYGKREDVEAGTAFLLDIVKRSIKDPTVNKAASNALSILTAMGYSFSQKNFAGIHAWHVNFTGGVFHDTDFSKSSLKGSKFVQAWLRGANFQEADMEGVKFGEMPCLDHTENRKNHKYGPGGVKCVTYSPDGRWIATACAARVYLWQASDSSLVKYFSKEDKEPELLVRSIAFNQQGNLAAASGKKVTLWDVEHGKEMRLFQGHVADVFAVAFRPESQVMATAGQDACVKLWNVDNGAHLCTFKDGAPVNCLAFSHDGKMLAVGNDEGILTLWSVEKAAMIATLFGDEYAIYCIAFSSDDRRLAFGSKRDLTTPYTRIWNLGDKSESDIIDEYKLKKKAGNSLSDKFYFSKDGAFYVGSLSFSSDGKRLISAACMGDTCSVAVLNSENGQILRDIHVHDSHVWSIAFSPDGKWLASAGSNWKVRLTDVGSLMSRNSLPILDPLSTISNESETSDSETEKMVHRLFVPLVAEGGTKVPPNAPLRTHSSMLLEGKRVAVPLFDSIQLFEVESGRLLATVRNEGSVSYVALDPTGMLLASAKGQDITVWEANSGKEIKRLKHATVVHALAFSPVNLSLASMEDHMISLWDVKSGQRRLFNVEKAYRNSLAFSGDGTQLIMTSEHGPLVRWSTQTGELLARLVIPEGSKVVSPDGTLVAVIGKKKTIHLMQIKKGGIPTDIGEAGEVTFSPNSQMLASSNGEAIKIWNIKAGKFCTTLHMRDGLVAFSPDGKWLASSSRDRIVHVWNIATGKCVGELNGSLKNVCHITWRDDVILIRGSPTAFEVGFQASSLQCWKMTPTRDGMEYRLYWRKGSAFDAKGCRFDKAIGLSPLNQRLLAQQRIEKSDGRRLDPGAFKEGLKHWNKHIDAIKGEGQMISEAGGHLLKE